MKTLLIALTLVTVGCKKKQEAAPAPAADCAAAVNKSMALSKAEMEKMGTDAAMMQKMVDIGIQRCTEDKWSADALKCMVDAKTMSDSQGCYGKLTTEQQDKMNKAAAELGRAAHDGSGAAGSGSAGSDSAGSGSAGSGSAGSGSAGSAGGGSAAPK